MKTGFQNIYLNIYFYTQIECFYKGLKSMKKKAVCRRLETASDFTWT